MLALRLMPPALAVAVAFPAASVPAQDGLEWATFLGGRQTEWTGLHAHCLAPGGDIVVGGCTDSPDFPVPNAWQSTHGGPSPASTMSFGDGFVARLHADCGGLEWSTFLGGSAEDAILGVTADATGSVTVCGVTLSQDFPVTAGAFQQSRAGRSDGFVARFVWNGQQLSLLWSTLLGGSVDDTVTGVAIHPSGRILVTGTTRSADFPIRGAPHQPNPGGAYDGFVAVLDATGSRLLSSTYLGGSLDDSAWTRSLGGELLTGSQIVLDQAGNPVIAGVTDSRDFPTTRDAYQPSSGGGRDGFVVRMDLALSRLTYGSYLGGRDQELLGGLALAPDGKIAVSGMTHSDNFPITPNCIKPVYDPRSSFPALTDSFVTLLDTRASGGGQLEYSSYWGGSDVDTAMGLAVDSQGMLVLSGFTASGNLPTTGGAYRQSRAAGWDWYVAQLDTRKSGVAQLRYGTHFGDLCNGYAAWGGVLVDDRSNALLFGSTACGSLPTSSTCYQQSNRGGAGDLLVAKLSLLPRGVARYGHSTPACLGPIHQTVNEWPSANNASFALEVRGAPPGAAGLIVFGSPNPPYCPQPLPGVECFLGGALVSANLQVADPAGGARYALPIPAIVPQTPPHGMATQWFFLTTPQCPGTGPVASSEGLSW